MKFEAIHENLSLYSGLNLISRCNFLNKKKSDYSLDFLKIALKECLKCGFVEMHKLISSQIPSPLVGYELSKEQEASVISKNKSIIEQKQAEIQNYKNIKKQISVRISYYELGKLYFEQGCLKEALETFLQSKEYNPGDNTLIDIAFQVKKIQTLTRSFDEKKSINYKETGYPSESNDELKACYWQMKILDAINAIASKDFAYALKLFRENLKYFEDIEELQKYSSARDVADYFVLLLLMSCGRNELLRSLKDEKERKLILYSGDSFGLLEALSNLDYVSAIRLLNKIFARTEYDPYISESHKFIYDSVLEKMIIQYLVPYKQISIAEISNIFSIPMSNCQQILIKMIKSNQISFLIDSINHNLVFINEQKDKKIKLYKKGLKTISNFLDNKLLGLLRFRLNEIVGDHHKKKHKFQENMEMEEFYEEDMAQMIKNAQDFL